MLRISGLFKGGGSSSSPRDQPRLNPINNHSPSSSSQEGSSPSSKDDHSPEFAVPTRRAPARKEVDSPSSFPTLTSDFSDRADLSSDSPGHDDRGVALLGANRFTENADEENEDGEEPCPKRRRRIALPALSTSATELSHEDVPALPPSPCVSIRVPRPKVVSAKPITSVDSSVVAEIYNYNFHMQPRIVNGIINKAYFGSQTFVLKQENVILAAATTKLHQAQDGAFSEILLCATNIFYRNCGMASLLVSVLVDKARREGCTHVVAWSAWTSQDFWIRRGFRLHPATKVELNYFHRTSLVFEDTYLMVLNLKSTSKATSSTSAAHPSGEIKSQLPQLLKKYHMLMLDDMVNAVTVVPEK